MPSSCSAPGCARRLEKGGDLKMFRFPMSNKERLDGWVRKVGRLPLPGHKSNRADGLWEPKEHDRICSFHFVKGCPSKDPEDVDYMPSIFSHTPAPKKTPKVLAEKVNRLNRVRRRDENKSKSAAALALLDLAEVKENPYQSTAVQATVQVKECAVQTDWSGDERNQYDNMFSAQIEIIEKQKDSLSDALNMLQIQNTQIQVLLAEVNSLAKKAETLKKELESLCSKTETCLLFETIKENNDQISFFTGLPNLAAFVSVFNAAKKKVKRKGKKLDLKDECLLTLVKIRHNPSIQDLAFRFGISKTLANRIFHAWVDALYKAAGGLVVWPSPDKELQLPDVFNNEQFKKVRCIIDCTEIFMERPTRLKARAQTYSNYKRHNTVKVLIGISPSGCVTFVSKVWGGRVSDKKITVESGLLDLFVPGDAVMADRGFLLQDEFAFRQVNLIMPAFTKGKKQLSAEEVEKSRQMSRARIHVERVIGRLKDFKILSGPLPIALVRKKFTVKKLLHIIGAIVNLNGSIV